MAYQLSRNQLLSLQQPVTEFLREELGLVVQQGKTMVCDVNRGVSFLGAYLKPWRRYVSSTSLRRMRRKLPLLRSLRTTPVELRASINSFLGIMSHYRSCRLRCQLFRPLRYLYNFGRFADDMRKYRLYPSLENSVISKKFYQFNK